MRLRSNVFAFVTVAAAAALPLALASGGQDLGQLKRRLADVAENATLRQLLVGRPLTTTIDDAVYDVPFLDPYDPPDSQDITVLPQAPSGGRLLRPGSFVYLARSYCVGLGARRPWRGDGYAYAPMKGPQAGPIRSILRNSARFPDIPQEEVQTLLWRIISRSSWTDLSAEQKAAAARLLSPRQIALLNGGALDLLPGDILDRSLAEAALAVARILGAEARMREIFASGEATYEEMEEVAVPAEDPELTLGRISPVRWSLHPGGYFIRYRPITYARTIIQVRVPEAVTIETDPSGRVLSIVDPARRRSLRIAYDDSVSAEPYPGAPGVRACRFKSVRFERPDPKNPEAMLRHVFTGAGGTLAGLPPAGKAGVSPLRWRYVIARAVAVSTQRTLSALPQRRTGARDASVPANIVHLALGLDLLLAQAADCPPWAPSLIDLVLEAWQYALCRAAGIDAVPAPRGPAADPAGGMARVAYAGMPGLAGPWSSPAWLEGAWDPGRSPEASRANDPPASESAVGQQTTFVTSTGEVIELLPELAVPGDYECQLIADSVVCIPTSDDRSVLDEIDDWLRPKDAGTDGVFEHDHVYFQPTSPMAAEEVAPLSNADVDRQLRADLDFWRNQGLIR